MRIGILEPLDFSDNAIKTLKSLGEVKLYDGKNINKFIESINVLFVRLNYYVGEDLLKHSKSLKYICSPTTGLNHIDLQYAHKHNISVISLKDEVKFLSDIRATSEHTFGLILSLLRNYKQAFILQKTHFDRDLFKGSEIYNNTIGIVGYGRVGRLLSKHIKGFDAIVYFYDNDEKSVPSSGVKRLNNINDLIEKCNIICLCASYSEENEKLINREYIDKLKGKFFINTSRGELVDEDYLIDKIEDGFFKGVALDVIMNESKRNNNLDRLLSIDKRLNFILTPHIAGATYTSMKRTEDFIVEKLFNLHIESK
jgi:D-3-phosphoglycerate dehydrogenase / 2-oxoglutarate reductase